MTSPTPKILILALALSLVTACTPSGSSDPILGTWKVISWDPHYEDLNPGVIEEARTSAMSTILTLKDDGTYEESFDVSYDNTTEPVSFTGTWVLEEEGPNPKLILVEITSQDNPREYRVEKLSHKNMTLYQETFRDAYERTTFEKVE